MSTDGAPQKPDLESGELTAALFDLVPCAVVVIDRDLRIVKANTSFQELYGEWKGRHCYEVFKRHHRPCGRCAALLTFEDGEVHVTEEQGVDKDGQPTFFEVKTAPLRDASGEVAYVLEMSVDITRYKALVRQYRLLFERVPCFVTVLDRDLQIVDANYRHQQTFGDAKGMPCHQVYMRTDTPCRSCPVVRTLADGRVHSQQKEALDKRGDKIHFLVYSAPIHDHRGEIVQVIEMATDITPMIEMQEKLLHTESDAALNRAMEVLSTTASQLRASFEETYQTLREGVDGGDSTLIERASDKLRSRIDHLAAVDTVFRRHRAGEMARQVQVDVGELVQSVVHRFLDRPLSSGMEVVGEAEPGLLLRDADPGIVQDCLDCLVHSFNDMCVPGHHAVDSHSVLLRGSSRPGGGVLFELSQRGLGEAEQTDPAREGLSIGLVVVRKTIEAHGGQVSVGSQDGRGITFQIELP
jgi:PAS domain S-box-containing protein